MIRQANEKDLDEIILLSKATLNNSFSKENLQSIIKEKETYHLFVIGEEVIYGFIILWISEENSQIIDFAINLKNRRLGYGKKLLNYSIDFLKDKNVKLISLEVRETNHNAIKLYELFDFKIIKTINNYYKNENGLLMMRSL